VEKDFQRALKWYRKAIFECDDPEAHVGIGRMYYLGNGVEKNVISACEHWKKAFAKHSPDAALYLGIANYSGLGIKRDVKQAKAYLQYAADNKYFYAFGKLARIAFDENRYINGTKLLIKGFILGRRL
jgi:TPR repeat protein